jgi:hypothetical protein
MNAHHAGTKTRKEGTGDLSSSDPEAALKLKKSREKQACYRQNMPAEKGDREQQRLDSIRMNETPEKMRGSIGKGTQTKRCSLEQPIRQSKGREWQVYAWLHV